MIVGALGIIFFGPLTIYMATIAEPFTILIIHCCLGTFISFWGAPMCSWLVEQFPPEVRLTACALGYNIALSIVGGFCPLVATVMISNFSITSPGILYVIVSIIALIGLYI